MKKKAVFFDCDGTIALSEEVHHHVIKTVLADYGINWTDEYANRILGTTYENCYRILQEDFNAEFTFDEFYNKAIDKFIITTKTMTKPHGKIKETFETLRNMGVQVAVVSNANRLMTEANLRAIGVSSVGIRVVTSTDVKNVKPNPEPYLRACYLLDVKPEEAIVMEDSQSGSTAGINANIDTYIYTTNDIRETQEYPNGVKHIYDLQELIDIVKES